VESPFWLKPARPAKKMARPQWHAPENQPLQLVETNIAELAARPRAIIASFGMVILLGVGAMTALTVEDTAGLQAEAETTLVSGAAKLVSAAALPGFSDSNVPAPGTTQIAQASQEAVAAGQDPASVTPPPQAVAAPPRIPAPRPVALVKIRQPAAAEISGLNHDDPRWARAASPMQPTPTAVAPTQDVPADGSGIAAFAASSAKADRAAQAAARPQSPGDQVITAAIPRLAVERPAPVPTDAADKQSEQKAIRHAQIRTAVNMRTGPADEAKVIGVVPTNATVDLVHCTSWCEIVFKNRRGFIYKGFVK
jgi:hypothetical protein